MKPTLSFFMCLIPVSIFAQIGREFKFDKINGDTVKSTEIAYGNTSLDENGVPILPEKGDNETVNFYQGGYLVESQYFEYQGAKRELSSRIILARTDAAVRQATIYTFHRGKESLLRAHKAEIANGKVIAEEIRNDRNENIGTVQYAYGKTSDDLDYEWIDAVGNRGSRKFYTVTDQHGVVFSMETFANDTLISHQRIEARGDTLHRSLLVNKKGVNNLPDSVLITVRKWLDGHGNPVLVLTQMKALTEPPPGEPQSINYVSAISYEYGKAAPKVGENRLDPIELYGAWRSEFNNMELFFEPKSDDGTQSLYGSSYLLNANEPSVEQYLAEGEIWKFMLKQDYKPGSWSLEEDGTLKVILSNASILSFWAYLEYNTLVLRPHMKDLKGELRLVKSR